MSAGAQSRFWSPVFVTIAAGGTVEWSWAGPHNVSVAGSEPHGFDEGSFSMTFASPGTYGFSCTIHPGMDGVVTVQ